MFLQVASGLCVYFIASRIWGIAKSKLLPRKIRRLTRKSQRARADVELERAASTV